jgi:hypothetical protein
MCFEGRRYRDFRYREKGGRWSSNFANHEIVKLLEVLALGHREGPYWWNIRKELACIRLRLGFQKLGESV